MVKKIQNFLIIVNETIGKMKMKERRKIKIFPGGNFHSIQKSQFPLWEIPMKGKTIKAFKNIRIRKSFPGKLS